MLTFRKIVVYPDFMQMNSSNPIRMARMARGWSLRQLADKAGVHVQALYLNECGCYPTVLPRLLDYLVTELRYDGPQVEKEYRRFVAAKRLRFSDDHTLDRYSIAALGEPRFNPVVTFRDSLRLSRMGFAKGICVQPAMLYSVENDQARKLPQELVHALQGARLPVIVQNELCTRYEEWCYV